MQTTVVQLIKQTRRARRITLRMMSEHTGKAISFLSEFENGTRPIPKDNNLLKTIFDFLELPSDDLLEKANLERESQSPKRLHNIVFKDPELLACLRQVSNEYENDTELREYLKKILQKERRDS